MAKIITFNQNDINYRGLWDKCKKFCEDNGFVVPGSPTIIAEVVVQGEDLGLVGLVGVEQVFHIEPLIATNPTTGLRLGSIAYGLALSSNCERVEVHVKDIRMNKMKPLLEKEDFVFVETTNIFTKNAN